jgi:transcriptional regulator with XRE-family HTH domain
MDSEYLRRLKDWVDQEIVAAGSQNKLAAKLKMSHATLTKWKSGNLKHGLDDSSINAIATYRGETSTETRAWLEGKTENLKDPVIEAVRNASFPSLVYAMEIGLERIKVYMETVSPSPEGRVYTMKNFNKVSLGMTQVEVEAVLGKGAVVSKSEILGQESVILQWTNSDGSNITLDLLDGKVNSVNQFGLK